VTVADLAPCLVTGGGGFLGLELVRQLREQGLPVTSLSRSPHPAVERLGARHRSVDLRDAAALRRALAGHRTVFHVAALTGVFGRARDFWSTNVDGTQAVLDACLRESVPRLVHCSSPSVVFDGRDHRDASAADLPYPRRFLSPYPASKAEAERRVLAAHGRPLADGATLATVALRPHLIVGPGDPHLVPRLLDRARRGRLVQVGPGRNRVSITDVSNAAAAHLQAALALHPTAPHGGRAYFVNQREPVELWPWLCSLLAAAGIEAPRRHLSLPAAYGLGAALEGLWTVLRLPGEPPMTRFVAQQLALDHTYSIAPAERDFGYREQVDLAACNARLLAGLRAAADR
jgi:nucleoside-diphosphate-sugar epimerase